MAEDEKLGPYEVPEEDKPQAHAILVDRQREQLVASAFQGDIAPADMTAPPQSKQKLDSETKEIGVQPGDPRRIAANASADTYVEGTETPDRPTPPTNYTSDAQETHPGTPPTPPELTQEDANSEVLEPVAPPPPEG